MFEQIKNFFKRKRSPALKKLLKRRQEESLQAYFEYNAHMLQSVILGKSFNMPPGVSLKYKFWLEVLNDVDNWTADVLQQHCYHMTYEDIDFLKIIINKRIDNIIKDKKEREKKRKNRITHRDL